MRPARDRCLAARRVPLVRGQQRVASDAAPQPGPSSAPSPLDTSAGAVDVIRGPIRSGATPANNVLVEVRSEGYYMRACVRN